jgi:hypothetical protein
MQKADEPRSTISLPMSLIDALKELKGDLYYWEYIQNLVSKEKLRLAEEADKARDEAMDLYAKGKGPKPETKEVDL